MLMSGDWAWAGTRMSPIAADHVAAWGNGEANFDWIGLPQVNHRTHQREPLERGAAKMKRMDPDGTVARKRYCPFN